MDIDRLLYLILLVPYGKVKSFYALPLVPWLVAFSIPLLIISSRRPQRAIWAISLMCLLNLHIAAQMLYTCYPEEKDGLVLNYSRRKCIESKIVVFMAITFSAVLIVMKAWR